MTTPNIEQVRQRIQDARELLAIATAARVAEEARLAYDALEGSTAPDEEERRLWKAYEDAGDAWTLLTGIEFDVGPELVWPLLARYGSVMDGIITAMTEVATDLGILEPS